MKKRLRERWSGSRFLPTDERRRRRREALIIVVLSLILLVFAVFEIRLPQLSDSSSPSGNIIFFLLINLNLILLVLLVFLVIRNLVKLVFERRRGILGAGLRTKLVLAFVGLSLVPTLFLFFVAQGFMSVAMETWFGGQVERSLAGSLRVAERYYQTTANDGLHYARAVGREIGARGLLAPSAHEPLQRFLAEKRTELNVDGLEVLVGQETIGAALPEDVSGPLPRLKPDDVKAALLHGESFARTRKFGRHDVVQCGAPVRGEAGEIRAVVVVSRSIPREVSKAGRQTVLPYQRYQQLKAFKQPVKNGYILTFLLITLVVIFSATWFGFYLAKGMTGPIQRLGEAMQEVAHGNLDLRIEREGDAEIATLADSFNRMAGELQTVRSALEERHRYIESILANIGAGVISIDAGGSIVTINPAAGHLLGMRPEDVLGQDWRTILTGALAEVGELVTGVIADGNEKKERQIYLRTEGREITAWVAATALEDPASGSRGAMLFFEDVSHLLRVERMEAWREVARRIAHEIKNPLTPIQLSAQRLQKRYAPLVAEHDGAILNECTRTIIGQVEQLKRLVNEFSAFARLPAVQVAPEDLNAVVEEALVLFRAGHPEIAFDVRLDKGLPRIDIDREAIRRAVVNLLDNAVAACDTSATDRAQVELVTVYDESVGVVRLEVADRGCGMTPDVKARAFEPYFSTKTEGTGLGLAIVSAVAADHHAYVRVRDNVPRGTRLVIEFPLRQSTGLRPGMRE